MQVQGVARCRCRCNGCRWVPLGDPAGATQNTCRLILSPHRPGHSPTCMIVSHVQSEVVPAEQPSTDRVLLLLLVLIVSTVGTVVAALTVDPLPITAHPSPAESKASGRLPAGDDVRLRASIPSLSIASHCSSSYIRHPARSQGLEAIPRISNGPHDPIALLGVIRPPSHGVAASCAASDISTLQYHGVCITESLLDKARLRAFAFLAAAARFPISKTLGFSLKQAGSSLSCLERFSHGPASSRRATSSPSSDHGTA